MKLERLIQEEGADVNATNNLKWTPLHFAAQYGNWNISEKEKNKNQITNQIEI